MSSSPTRLSHALWLLAAMAIGATAGIYMANHNVAEKLTGVMPGAETDTVFYRPQSEAGAFLIAQRAEAAADWPVTHRALQYLEQVADLPPAQSARLFLSSIAAADWDTAEKVLKDHPEIMIEGSPLLQMLAAIMYYADGNDIEATRILSITGYHPITAPLLPFVKGWITGETPRLGLVEAAQDISFSTINTVRFFEATKQYEKSDSLMTKLQDADLNVSLLSWSLAYFERRDMMAEAKATKTKLEAKLALVPSSLWHNEEARIRLEAGGHLKSNRHALALTLLDSTNFLENFNATALALLYAQLANKLAPDIEDTKLTLASIYDLQENWDEALAQYAKVDKKDPSYAMARLHAADILARAERTDEARAAYRALTRDFPENPEMWYQQAEFLRVSAEDFDAAIDSYTRAAALFGNKIPEEYWTLFLARGLCYEMTDRPEKAEADYEAALDLQPDHPEALNTLAYAWADKGKNLDKAEDMLKRALRADMNAPHIIDSLAWVFYKKGQAEKAIPLLERAVQMLPYDATVNEHLGDVYAAVGRTREAQYMWQRALDAAETDKQKAALRAKLEQ